MLLPPRLQRFEVADNGCWNWTGSREGRGRLRGRISARGKWRRAHREVYEALRGPIPDGLTLDHLCFNPLCVNPAHLEPCTVSENSKRLHARNAHLPKVKKPQFWRYHAKLDEQQVLAIRADDRSAWQIAADYGVTRNTIYRIRSGRRWGWLTQQVQP